MTTQDQLVKRSAANRRGEAVAVHAYQRALAFDNRRVTIRAWQDRVRDPSLPVPLALELWLLFIAAPCQPAPDRTGIAAPNVCRRRSALSGSTLIVPASSQAAGLCERAEKRLVA